MSSSRFTRPLILVLFVALLSTVPRPARAEIVHGFLTAQPDLENVGGIRFLTCGEAYDFSAQTIVRHDSAGADLCFGQFVQNTTKWYLEALPHLVGGVVPHGAALEDILIAPETGYTWIRDLFVGGRYVIKTGDGLYAKIRVQDNSPFFPVTIEYYVQLDGSRNLNPLVPVEPSTWGRVKALYAE